jgi:hypothetical protein
LFNAPDVKEPESQVTLTVVFEENDELAIVP